MASKRASSRSAAPSGAGRGPLFNAVLLGAAVCAGLAMLVSRGRMSWPPTQLLASLYTVAGCLAIVGPFVLGRKEAGEAGIGEFLWMTGGLLIWVLDGVALVRGEWRGTAWVTPLGYPGDGADDAGDAPGRLALWARGVELVVDERHGLAVGTILGRAGGCLGAPAGPGSGAGGALSGQGSGRRLLDASAGSD